MIAAAVLAGGRATRLGGQPKALLPLGGVRIIDRQLSALAGVAAHVLIVANDPAPFSDLGVRVVPDRVDAGAIGGLYTALLESGADATVVVACDLPFVTAAFLQALVDARDGADVVVPRTAEGLHPLCACWAAAAAPALERQIAGGNLRITDVLASGLRVREVGPDTIARYDKDGTLLFNVNTPHDYARGLRMIDPPGGRARGG